MGRDPPIPTPPRPVAGKDVAQTFAESDVSMTLPWATVAGEGVEMSGSASASATADALSSPSTITAKSGMEFSVRGPTPVTEVSADINPNSTGYSRAGIRDLTEGTTVTTKYPGSFSTVTFSGLSLDPSHRYAIWADDDGNSWDRAPVNPNSAPDEFGAFDLWQSDGAGYGAYTDVTVTAGSDPAGVALIEWPMAPDVYAWDVAQYLAEKDGETVDVFVEEEQAGGWTEIAGPISRGDRIQADAANNVRYRVELSRASTANNPRLEAIYRRFKL
jgi:hypothetical protein